MSEVEPHPGGTFDDAGYGSLCRETSTYRERLVVRLAGEVGLRPGEMARLRLEDVTARVHDGRVHYFLAVSSEDGSTARDAYLPADVERELSRYAASNGLDEDESVFGVSPRRLQMLVSEVAERAAAATGDRSLASVSSSDLRRLFARRLLREGVPPSVVMSVGGWRRLDSLTPDVEPGHERIAAAFDGSDAGGDSRFRAAFDRLEGAAALLDANGVIEHVNRRFEAVTRLDREAALGRELRDLAHSIQEREYAAMWEAVVAGERWSGPVATAVADGEPVRGRLTLAAIGSGPRPDGFVATFRSHDETAAGGQSQRTLDRLGDVQAATRTVGEGLADASTQDGALRVTCDRVAAGDAFVGAWVTDAPAEGLPEPTYRAGFDEGGESVVDRDATRRLTHRALREQEVRTTTVTTESMGTLAVAAIPLTNGDTHYGTVGVARHAETPAGERVRAALATLGERVAGTLAAIEWKRLLLADAVLELEFEGSPTDSVFSRVSSNLDCDIRVEGVVPLDGGSLLFYVTVSGVAPERAVSRVGDAAASARLIADYSEESLLEVTVEERSLPGAFIEQGANVTGLTVEGGRPRLVCEVAPSTEVRELATAIADAYPSVTLVAKREVERSVHTPMEFQQTLEERLTSKQRSVLQAAYHAGYFDWPRGSTAEELADSIGVSSPTLHNHLRRGQQKLLAAFFEEPDE